MRPGEVGLWRSSLVMNIVMRLSRARSVTMHNIYADFYTNIYTDIYTNIYTDKRSDRVGGEQLLPRTFLTPIYPGKYCWKLLDTQTH